MPETIQVQHPRAAVLADLPVTEHRMQVAGVETSVLVGGDGPPMVLLPGPGESALWWARVLPRLVASHRVVAPDLPGTGDSGHMPDGVDTDRALDWLDELVARTCDGPPALVGHVVGGALAARYAVRHPDRLRALVLVDTLGLRRFLPSPAFGFRLFRFLSDPTQQRFEPFLDQCMHDADAMKEGFGPKWDAFLEYYLSTMQDPDRKAAMGDLIKHLGARRIPGLSQIRVPTTLVWGRHDKATPLKVAEAASRRYGWPLHVIEHTRDDPKLERPGAFLDALEQALEV